MQETISSPQGVGSGVGGEEGRVTVKREAGRGGGKGKREEGRWNWKRMISDESDGNNL